MEKPEKEEAIENMKTQFRVAYWNSWTLDASLGRWAVDTGCWTLDSVQGFGNNGVIRGESRVIFISNAS